MSNPHKSDEAMDTAILSGGVLDHFSTRQNTYGGGDFSHRKQGFCTIGPSYGVSGKMVDA